MTLEQDLVEFVNSRPDWQRTLVGQLCRGEHVRDSDVAALSDSLIHGATPKAADLDADEIPGAPELNRCVVLGALKDVQPTENWSFRAGPEGIVYQAGATFVIGLSSTSEVTLPDFGDCGMLDGALLIEYYGYYYDAPRVDFFDVTTGALLQSTVLVDAKSCAALTIVGETLLVGSTGEMSIGQ